MGTGWRIPTPHECLFVLVAMAITIVGLHLFPPGSVGDSIAQAVMGFGGLIGIPLAAQHLPDRVQAVLLARDKAVNSALAATGSTPAPLPPVPPAGKP
jgi:hypothetical protein